MKKYICFFLICFTAGFNISAFAQQKRDFKTELEGVLVEDRLAFDPVLVEDTLTTAFNDPHQYDLEMAATTYDELSERNKGYMSLEELFYVCLRAFRERPDDPWSVCKQQFILPLLTISDELSFIDDAIIEAYDGHAFNQQCTPPAWDMEKLAPNIVCTTGRFESSDPAFEKAMITKFRTEGGCTDIQKDGCHRTCYGVCSGNVGRDGKYRVYNEKLENDWRHKTNTFTRQDAEDYGYDMYTKNKIYLLPDAIRGDVFMALWGTGQPRRSIGLLQQVLGVQQTNKVDDETIMAASNYNNGNLRKKFLKARWQQMKDNGSFSNGWARGFMVYLKNGCHTVSPVPLYRNAQTMAGCK
jgi:hypothetical protein